LLFGQMYEDSAVELTAFARGSRVFCIASAGCTAFDLAARGDDVTAVDLNPAQVEYVRRRLEGRPTEQGTIDQWLDRLRRLAPAVGWRRSVLERFCSLEQPDVQLEFWRRNLDTRRFRLALAAAFTPKQLQRAYASPFVAVLPPRFDLILRRRLERGIGRHANSRNPYAAALLLGRPREAVPAPLRLVTSDAAEFLERCPPRSFDGLTLSNIVDGADEAYGARLFAAVRRAAVPGAVAILRSFREPLDDAEAERAADDRSLIWGSIRLERL
jgi:S-adenosylmethionine:diacylglycerol 3-amino-3-carboxypropyl transferase